MKRVANIGDFPTQPHYIMIDVLKYNSDQSAAAQHPMWVTTDLKDLEETVKNYLMRGCTIMIFDKNGSAIPTLEVKLNLRKVSYEPPAKSSEIQIHEE